MNITKEKWKPVVGYEGIYEVSDLGRIKSLSRLIDNAQGNYQTKDRILVLHTRNTGYSGVGLYRGKKVSSQLVHRIVMESFRGKSPLDTDHINGVRTDNRLENLRYCTRSQNCMNRKKRENCSSKYKGVCWHEPYQKWMAYIQLNGGMKNLGYFRNEKEAAIAYDNMASKHFREFSKTNLL